MDYNSTFLGLIVAGVILVAIGFGLVLTQPAAFRPASAVMAIESPKRERSLSTIGESRPADDRTDPTGTIRPATSSPNSSPQAVLPPTGTKGNEESY